MTNCNLDEKDQKTLIEMIYSSPSVFSRVRPILKSEYFDKKFQPTINYLLDFSQQYNTLPILEQLNNESRIEYQYLNDIENNVNVQSSILDTCEKFVKKRALELAIEEAYSYIAKGETSGIDKIIKDAQNISLAKDLGMNFWDKPSEWLKQQESEQGILPTGWKTFDDMMYGGFGWGELNYVVAPVNAGKSVCMQNMALNWSMNGYNVLFFTLEMNRRLVGKRMASMAANVPYRDIRKNIDKVSDSIIYRRKDIQPGVLQLVDLPIGCNANDIEGFIQTFEIQTNIIPQIIVIDYADIMTPCDKRIDPNNLNRVDKAISLELRDIARERTKNGKNTMILTASQITKDSMDEMEFGMSNVAGGTTKTQNADNIFSVRTNDAMRQRGEYEFKFLKTRNAGSKDKKLKMKFNVDTLLISDLEEMQTQTMDTNSDPTQNINPMASANLQAALASLKGLSK